MRYLARKNVTILPFLLGFAYLKSGDATTAKTIFSQMFEAAGSARAQFLLGKASYEAAILPQAEQSLLAVLRLDLRFPGIHLELGKVYISERRTDDAVTQLKEALKENPNNEGQTISWVVSWFVKTNISRAFPTLRKQSAFSQIPMASIYS